MMEGKNNRGCLETCIAVIIIPLLIMLAGVILENEYHVLKNIFLSSTSQPSNQGQPPLIPSPIIPHIAPGYPGGELITLNNTWQIVSQYVNDVEMVLVPSGCFTLGSTDAGFNSPVEQPLQEHCVGEPFWIDRYEVTNEQYGSSGYFSGANHPRETILWSEALAHCEARGARLPTELEWEYAARGPDNLRFPWGNTIVSDNVVWNANSNRRTAPVGSKPSGASWVGAMDMAGNVWEWVSSVYISYPYNSDDGRESRSNSNRRVVRGGAWDSDEYRVRSAFRYGVTLQEKDNFWGFRCARSY